MQALYSPLDEAELLVLQGLLIAYGVPHHVRCGHGAAFPGLYIPHYSAKTILVPVHAWEDAHALVESYLQAPSHRHSARSPIHGLRMLVEALLCGWFVPPADHLAAQHSTEHAPGNTANS